MGTAQAQGRSLSCLPLQYAAPQGLLQAGVSVCEQFQGLEEPGKGIGVQCGAAWGALGQLCPEGEGHCPTRELGREARLLCPAPSQGDDLPLCLPLTPARMEQFNPLHLCSPAGRSWWDPLVQRCWQRLGERLAQVGAHLPGSQGGSLPSLTDAGTTMGRDAPRASSEPRQTCSQEHTQSSRQGRALRAAWPRGHGAPPLPQHHQASPVPARRRPCPSPESWCAVPGPLLHHAASAEPAGKESPGKPCPPPGPHPLAPGPGRNY